VLCWKIGEGVPSPRSTVRRTILYNPALHANPNAADSRRDSTSTSCRAPKPTCVQAIRGDPRASACCPPTANRAFDDGWHARSTTIWGVPPFANHTVDPEIALAKAPQGRASIKSANRLCGVTRGIGAVSYTAKDRNRPRAAWSYGLGSASA